MISPAMASRSQCFDRPVLRLSFWFLLGSLMAGCGGKSTTVKGYYGPTQSLAEVVAEINRNNQALPTLYARIAYLDAYITDPRTKRTHFVNAEGDLFVRKPRELWLRGKKSLVNAFDVGSTADRYWMTVYFDQVDTMWWGWHRNAGKACVKDVPIRPEAMGEVLGIGNIAGDLKSDPAPVMRFNNDLDVYMLTWIRTLPDRWYAEKEIWYDRQTKRPRKVLLYDQAGRVVLRADLSAYQQVAIEGGGQMPWVATSYDLFFPETRSRMILKLSDVALVTRTGHPTEGTISFPDDPGVSRVIQVDEDCEE